MGLLAAGLVLTACSGSESGTPGGPSGAPTNDIARVIGGATAPPGAPATPPGSSRPPESSKPPKPADPSVPRGERARELVRLVALTPQDWGPDFQKQEGYEDDNMTRYTVGQDCKGFEDGTVPGGVASMYRYTFKPTAAGLEQVFAVSGATVYEDVAAAEAEMATVRADAARCRAQTLAGGERLTSVVTHDLKDVDDTDDVVVTEATWVAADGRRNAPYVWVTARRGAVIVAALAVDLKATDVEATEDIAFKGAATMIVRVRDELAKG